MINRFLSILKFYLLILNKRTYDLIIPFGFSCHTAMMLNNLHLRKFSSPFDWIIPSMPQKNNLDNRFKLLVDFKEFFNYEDFEFFRDKITTSGHYTASNNKFGFEVGHEFEPKLSNIENFRQFKNKYNKRYKRLLYKLKSSKKILFVYMSNTWDQRQFNTENVDIKSLSKNFLNIKKLFPNKDFEFVIFENNSKLKIGQIQYEDFSNGISRIVSNHKYPKIKQKTKTFHNIISVTLFFLNVCLAEKE